jgi:hypothetical protein
LVSIITSFLNIPALVFSKGRDFPSLTLIFAEVTLSLVFTSILILSHCFIFQVGVILMLLNTPSLMGSYWKLTIGDSPMIWLLAFVILIWRMFSHSSMPLTYALISPFTVVIHCATEVLFT